MKEVVLMGKEHKNIDSIHQKLDEQLDFGPYYGRNYSALLDALTTAVSRPVKIVILDADFLKSVLGSEYELMIRVFEKVCELDKEMNLDEKFEYELK